MGTQQKYPLQNSSASFCTCTKLAVFLFCAMTISLSSVAFSVVAETTPDQKNSEFFFACSDGKFSEVKAFVEADPSLVHATTKDGEHCLHLSALEGNADVVRLLLEKGADPDIRSEWESGLRMHPLSWNTFYGRSDIVELLLKHGADANADFDRGPADANGEVERVTVLDVVEQILMHSEDNEDKKRFVETRNVLVRNGAMRYASLEQEL